MCHVWGPEYLDDENSFPANVRKTAVNYVKMCKTEHDPYDCDRHRVYDRAKLIRRVATKLFTYT